MKRLRSLALLLACAGCTAGKAEPPEYMRTSVDVAGLPEVELDRYLLTIVVTPEEVVLLGGATLQVNPALELARADPRRAEDHVIAVLREGIAREATPDPALNRALVIVHPQVEMEVLVDVLFTAGRAGMSSYGFAVSTPAGARALLIDPPRVCEHTPLEDECLQPGFTIAGDGIFARGKAAERVSSCAPTKPYPHRLTGEGGLCPLPRRDFTELAALLDAPRAMALCPTAAISAETNIEWAELATLAAFLQGERGLAPLIIEAGGFVDCRSPPFIGRPTSRSDAPSP